MCFKYLTTPVNFFAICKDNPAKHFQIFNEFEILYTESTTLNRTTFEAMNVALVGVFLNRNIFFVMLPGAIRQKNWQACFV